MKNRVRRIAAILTALVLLLTLVPFSVQAAEGIEILSVDVDVPNAQLGVTLRVDSDFYRSNFDENAVFHVDNTEVKMVANSFKTDEPIGYILVIDRSGYYTAHLKYDYVKQTAIQIINSLPEQDRVAVVFVDNGIECNGTFMLKSAASTLVNGSSCASPGVNPPPSTAVLYKGLQKALQLAATQGDKIPEQKAIVVLSDFGADDDAAIKSSVLEQLDGSIPLITVPFFCEGYTTGEKTRQAAMAVVEASRPELLGRTMLNVEIVRPAQQDFDYSQISTVSTAISEMMYFASFDLDITPLYQAGASAKNMRLQIQNGSDTLTAHVNINVSALPTPIPTEVPATPTPDPNPVILRFGDENATVLQLKQILTDLYYYEGELNRTFDTDTQIALMELCEDNGLEFSDVLREDMWKQLQSGNIKPNTTPVPTITPEPEATRDPNLMLVFGDSNTRVYTLQQKLAALYYLNEDERTMVYDEATQRALYEFCENNGIELQDGVTITMWNLLQSGNAVPKETPTPEPVATPTPTATRDPNQKFAQGDRTGEVRSLQNYLITNFYMAEECRTGEFDGDTQWAVDTFCIVNGLATIDDGMSRDAWEKLISGSALANPTTTPVPVTPEPTRDPQMKFLLDDNNGEVIMLQRNLVKLYYLEEKDVTGVFDQTTLIAVVAFCDINGLPVTEGMSFAAWERLMSDESVPNPTATPKPVEVTPEPVVTPTVAPEYLAIAPGDSNEYVSRYQQKLLEMGYLTEEFVAGTFDEATQRAQDLMCEYNNFAKQTGANVDIQGFAFSSTLKSMSTMSFFEKLEVELSRNLQIGEFKLPIWVIACAVLLLVLILIVILLLMSGKKKSKKRSSGSGTSTEKSGTSAGQQSDLSLSAEDQPTSDIDVNTDVPTSENVNEWPVVLTIQFMGGAPTDYHYMLTDDVPIKIGRRSGSDVLLNASDTIASRDHGQLVYRGSQLYYVDTSKKGSIVDGTPLNNAEKAVSNGSVIEISRHVIRIGL